MPFLQEWQLTVDIIFTVLFYLTIYSGNPSILIHKYLHCVVVVVLQLPSTSLCHPLFNHFVYKHLGHFQYFPIINSVTMNNLTHKYFHRVVGISLG